MPDCVTLFTSKLQCFNTPVKQVLLENRELLRIFYYDAPPLQSKVTNPLDKHAIDLGQSDLAKNSRKLHSELVMRSDFALRMGELKIGMNIACMAIRQTVDIIVMIIGDSDLVPALELARREGCVQFKERKLTDVLIIHSDKVLEVSIHLDSPLEI